MQLVFRMRVLAVLAIILYLGAPAAQAGVTFYFNETSWNNAVSDVTHVSIPNFDNYLGSGTASLSFDGVTVGIDAALGDGSFFNISASPPDTNTAVLSSQQAQSGEANLLVTLPVPVYGFALRYGTFYGSDVSIVLFNGDSMVVPSIDRDGYAASSFIAWTSSSPFTKVLLTSPDYVLNIGNFAYAEELATVPEPSSVALVGVGLAGLLGLGRLRRAR